MGNEATSLQNIPTTNLVRERYTPPLFPVMSPSDQRKGKHSPKISCFDDPEMNSIADNGKRTIKEINEQIQQLGQVQSTRKDLPSGEGTPIQQQINKAKSVEARSFEQFLERQRSYQQKKKAKIELCRNESRNSKRHQSPRQVPVTSPRTNSIKAASPAYSAAESTRTSQNNSLLPVHSERSKSKKLIDQYLQIVSELTSNSQKLSYLEFSQLLKRVGFVSSSTTLTHQLIKQRTLVFQAWSELKCQQTADSMNLLSFIFAVMGQDLSRFWTNDRQFSKTEKTIRTSEHGSSPSIWSNKTAKGQKQSVRFYTNEQILQISNHYELFCRNRMSQANKLMADAHNQRVINEAIQQGILNPHQSLSHAEFLNINKKLQQIRRQKQLSRQKMVMFRPNIFESPRHNRQWSKQRQKFRSDAPPSIRTDRTQEQIYQQETKQIILHVDIKLNQQQVERITLKVTDSAGQAALNFVKKHNLDLKLVGHLTRVIQSNIDKVRSQNGI